MMWIVILIGVLALGSAFLIYSNSKDDVAGQYTGIDKNKVAEEILEQEQI